MRVGIGLYKPYEPEGQSLDRAHSVLMILYFLHHLSLLCVTDVDRQTVAFPAFHSYCVTDATWSYVYCKYSLTKIHLLIIATNTFMKDFINLIFNH